MKPFLNQQPKETAAESKNYEEQITALLKADPGIAQKWYEPQANRSAWQLIDIPFKKDTSALQNHKGSVWFAKEFEVPMHHRGKNLQLALGRIADYDEVWVNGHPIGHQFGSGKWRKYLIESKYINPKGKNVIVWRVFNARATDLTQDKNPLYFNFHDVASKDGYTVLAGQWQYQKGISLEKEIIPPVGHATKPNEMPSSLYNGMIAPFIPMAIEGVIWYQGETNARRAAEYTDHFAALITDWRKQWKQGDFPFLFVQLANYHAPCKQPCASEWAELREAQAAALALPQTGMASAIDLGQAHNIHPPHKEEVGRRLALQALAIAYGRPNIDHKHPNFSGMTQTGQAIEIKMQDVGEGLTAGRQRSVWLPHRFCYCRGRPKILLGQSRNHGAKHY